MNQKRNSLAVLLCTGAVLLGLTLAAWFSVQKPMNQSTWENAPVSDRRTQLVLLIPFADDRYQLGNGLLTQLDVPGL